MKKVLALILVAVLAMSIFAGCGSKPAETTPEQNDNADAAVSVDVTELQKEVRFTMENGETFTMEMYPQYAPKTVENFLKLVSEGFYDGLTFHRVVDNFMAQGGDPMGTGVGGADETIPGEFSSNGFAQNTLSHTRGVVSMARSQSPDSASSQFFICYGDATFLDGNYAAFGKVVEGMETVDNFLKVERTYNSGGELASPITPIVIAHAEVVA